MTIPTPLEPSPPEILAFEIASEPGNERRAMLRVAETLAALALDKRTSERLQTAVAETVLNAMEHGHKYNAALPVVVRVEASDDRVLVTVTDSGGGPLPQAAAEPNLAAKLSGEQPVRGWGLFLIRSMVDEMTVESDERHHSVRLSVFRAAPQRGDAPPLRPL